MLGLLRKKLLLLVQSAYSMTVQPGLLILLMAPAISYIGKDTVKTLHQMSQARLSSIFKCLKYQWNFCVC